MGMIRVIVVVLHVFAFFTKSNGSHVLRDMCCTPQQGLQVKHMDISLAVSVYVQAEVHSHKLFTNSQGYVSHLPSLLLLAGDIEINPGPVNFGFVNCRSIRNKGPAIADLLTSASLDVFGMTETHIRSTDTPS